MGTSQRIATIFFTDIVGYTAMMDSNEEETMLLIEKNRAIHTIQINKFGGTYVKEIGDGTLAYFDNAYDAVSCAMAIQTIVNDELKVQLRIGIHRDETIFEHSCCIQKEYFFRKPIFFYDTI